jgi:hypothetical protein
MKAKAIKLSPQLRQVRCSPFQQAGDILFRCWGPNRSGLPFNVAQIGSQTSIKKILITPEILKLIADIDESLRLWHRKG